MAAWRTILEAVRLRRPALASVLEHASLLQCDGARVLLGYEPGSFLAAQATDAAAIGLLTAAVREHFGPTTEVAFDLAVARGTTQTIAQIDGAERKARVEAARRAVADHPLVSAAIELLGAELRDVRLSQDYAD
jgi:DNA polymerase-3 subunit gamma/tau